MADDEFLVLHALRVRGMAGPDAIEEAWGVEAAGSHLERLSNEGCCSFRETPRASGYLLLPPGRDRHASLLDEYRSQLPAEALPALEEVYGRFEPINGDFKDLCSRWQMRGSAMNDHSDAAYDEDRIGELEELHGRFLPIVMRAAKAVPHYGSYPARFRQALRRLSEDGDLEYFTKPFIDSYHTIWFEFHEDLIATLGRQRQPHEA
jgi:hypothetical protein